MTTFSRAGLAAAATRASPGIAPRETRDAARCAYVVRETRATSRGGRARLGASRGGSRPVRALLGDQEVRSPPARHPSTRAVSLSRHLTLARSSSSRSPLAPSGGSRGFPREILAAPTLRLAPTRARERTRRSRRATSHPPCDPRNPPRSSTRRSHRVRHPRPSSGSPDHATARPLAGRRAARFPAADVRDSSSLPLTRLVPSSPHPPRSRRIRTSGTSSRPRRTPSRPTRRRLCGRRSRASRHLPAMSGTRRMRWPTSSLARRMIARLFRSKRRISPCLP